MPGPYYWVGGSGNTSDATNHWATIDGGPPNVANVPTSADDVHFTALSNLTAYTVTVNVTFTCRDMMFDAAPSVSGTITLAGSGTTNCHGNLVVLAGMLWSGLSTLQFPRTSGVSTLNTNGVRMGGSIAATGAGGTLQLISDVDFVGNVFKTSGTFDPNGHTVTLSGAAPVIGTTGGATLMTFFNLSRVPLTPAKTNTMTVQSNITVTGTLKYLGNDAANPQLIASNVLGTPRTITAAAIDAASDFTDFQDINLVVPGGDVNVGTSIGNRLGNSGITFTPSTPQFWKTTTTGVKTWSTAGNWFLGTNGTGGAGRVPLPQDDWTFDASSIGAASTTISIDMPVLGRTGTMRDVTNTPTVSHVTVATFVFGSLTLPVGTWVITQNKTLTFAARSPVTLTSNGKSALGLPIVVQTGATVTAQDATSNNGALTVNGTFDDGGFSYTSASSGIFSVPVGGTLINNGLITIVPAGATWQFAGTYLGSGTIKLITGGQIFQGGSKSYNNVWLSGAGLGSFDFTGSNTIANLQIDTLPKNVRFTAATTTTVGTVTVPAYDPQAVKFVRFPGSGISTVGTPDSVPASITGDIDVQVLINNPNWAVFPNAVSVAAAKFKTAGQSSWECYFFTNGLPKITWSTDGTAITTVSATASASTVFTSGWGWVRFKLVVATGQASFDTAPDVSGSPGAWTQLGSLPAAVGATSIFDGTDPVTIGGRDDTSLQLGVDVGRVRIYSGIAGVLKVDFNPNDWVSGNAFTSSTTGEVWTRNGSALFSPEVKISSITAATHTLTSTGALVNIGDHGVIDHSIVNPANTWFAGRGGIDGGSNTRWVFLNGPLAKSAAVTAATTAQRIRALTRAARAAAATVTARRVRSITKRVITSVVITARAMRLMTHIRHYAVTISTSVRTRIITPIHTGVLVTVHTARRMILPVRAAALVRPVVTYMRAFTFHRVATVSAAGARDLWQWGAEKISAFTIGLRSTRFVVALRKGLFRQ